MLFRSKLILKSVVGEIKVGDTVYATGLVGTVGTPTVASVSTVNGQEVVILSNVNTNKTRIDVNANFGQRPFTYAAPAGFNTLNTYNLTTPSKTWFSSGNNSGRGSATAYPDFVWIKSRSSAQNH